jgi:hypothetical protein
MAVVDHHPSVNALSQVVLGQVPTGLSYCHGGKIPRRASEENMLYSTL